jgi:hypothetical protein
MVRRKKKWEPPIGAVAQYVGGYSSLSRHGHTVRVIAEASGQRMIVEAIGKRGVPVRITVKTENLAPVAPGLFD